MAAGLFAGVEETLKLKDEIRLKFAEQERGLNELRQLVLGETEDGPKTDDPNGRRYVMFLKPFYDAPEHALTWDQKAAAADAAKYNIRGTGSFYRNPNPLLKVEGDLHLLTPYGVEMYEKYAQQLGDPEA